MNTKRTLTALTLLIIFIVRSNISLGQVTVPNNVFTPGAFVGWNAVGGANPLEFRTNNTNRGGIAGNTGFWGIGNTNTFTPQDLLHIDDGFASFARFTNNNTGAGAGDGFRVGLLGLTAALIQQENASMLFATNNTPRMTILGPNGFVGINTGAPAFRLDVNGDINTPNIANQGYRIGGIVIIQKPGPQNTIVGEGAGGATPGAGQNNTYIGFQSGFNTNPLSLQNTFAGVRAGFTNQSSGGTFSGFESGQFNTSGDFNTFYGFRSGRNNTNGTGNSFFGGNSGLGNISGNNNVFIGGSAGITNTTGNLNTTIGTGSNVFSGNLTNATAIGSGSVVRFSNNMILGDNTVNVGIGLSGNALGPQDKLEINSNVSGVSGLQFRQLTSANIPVANPGTGVLAVNAAGKVIYVTGGGTGTVNNAQNGTSLVGPIVELGGNPLIHCTEVPLNGFDFFFSGNGVPFANQVAIGKACNVFPFPVAKLDVLQSSTTTNSIGINVENTDNGTAQTPAATSRGVVSIVSNTSTNNRIAGFFSTPMIPVPGIPYAIFVPNLSGHVNFGYSVLGTTSDLVEINGNININGDINGTGNFNYTSDAQLKTNISDFHGGLSIVKQINPVYYNFNGKAQTKTSETHIGAIAQQIGTIAPFAVDTFQAKLDTSDANFTKLLSIKSEALVYMTINAIKQLDSLNTIKDSLISNLLTRVSALETTVNSCCSNNNFKIGSGSNNKTGKPGESGSINVELKNSEDALLYQNEPNPFGEQTTIRYYIPENAGKAEVVFYDEFGRIIKSVEIMEKGNGKLDVNTASLASGIYSYSLIVNGVSKNTKRMVRSR